MTALAGYNLTAGSATREFALGTEINVNGATYQYVQAGAAIAAYDLVQVLSTGKTSATSSVTTTTVGAIPANVGPAQHAVSVDEYFWLPIGPFHLKHDGTAFKVNALIDCAKDKVLYTTATAGNVDDANGGSDVLVAGLVGTTTITAAAAMEVRAVSRLTVTAV